MSKANLSTRSRKFRVLALMVSGVWVAAFLSFVVMFGQLSAFWRVTLSITFLLTFDLGSTPIEEMRDWFARRKSAGVQDEPPNHAD